MKKELLAALTLLALLMGACANTVHLKQLITEIDEHLFIASQACTAENFAYAQKEFDSALQLWLDADDYTHVFIRHSEIDATADAFYDVLSAIQSKELGEARSAFEKLDYHLNSILTIEYVTLRSVF